MLKAKNGAEIYEGTLSEGDLRPRTLFLAFRAEIHRLGGKGPARVPPNRSADWYETELCAEMIDEMQSTLTELVAEHGLYFGAHEGDGADFGFWRVDPE